MNKKSLICLLLIIVLITSILFYTKQVYAVDNFLEVEEKEVTKNDNVEIIININKITYNKFKIELTSDLELTDINTKENINLEKGINKISLEIDKENVNLEKIVFSYKIAEDKKDGDTITFVANVINLDNEKETSKSQVIVTIKKEDDDKKEEEQKKNTNNENKDEEVIKKEEKDITYDKNEEDTKKSSESVNINSEKSSNVYQSVNTEVVKYNGSDNNYLSSLSIDGYALNKEFCKDNSNYFVTISDTSVDNINISAEAEEDKSIVCIYGEKDLKEGINKILINVTAENGDIRTYRIYVTIKA